MARILRGDIILADLNPTIGHEQAGKRPVLVLSHEVFNKRSGTAPAYAEHSPRLRRGECRVELCSKLRSGHIKY